MNSMICSVQIISSAVSKKCYVCWAHWAQLSTPKSIYGHVALTDLVVLSINRLDISNFVTIWLCQGQAFVQNT